MSGVGAPVAGVSGDGADTAAGPAQALEIHRVVGALLPLFRPRSVDRLGPLPALDPARGLGLGVLLRAQVSGRFLDAVELSAFFVGEGHQAAL